MASGLDTSVKEESRTQSQDASLGRPLAEGDRWADDKTAPESEWRRSDDASSTAQSPSAVAPDEGYEIPPEMDDPDMEVELPEQDRVDRPRYGQ